MKNSGQDAERPSCWSTSFARISVLIGFLLTLSCSHLAIAQTAQDFTKVYDSYLAAIKSGSYSQVSPLLAAEVRNQVKTTQDQAEYMMMQKMMAPIRYETLSLNM